MSLKHLIAGRADVAGAAHVFAFAAVACGILTVAFVLTGLRPSLAADEFPFDQELLLDAAPMRPAKRVPILTVAPNGNATVDLWCRTVPARVQLSDGAIRVEPGPLPEALPPYMSEGQCNEQRMRADTEMLDALAQVTTWRRHGNTVLLNGATSLRFRLSDH